MIQRRLADQLGQRLGLGRRDSEALLRNMTRSWAKILKGEGELSLPALGRLQVKERSSRTISDVRTKARRVLFGKKAIAFRPLPKLRDALNPGRPRVSIAGAGAVTIPIRIAKTASRPEPPVPPPPPPEPQPVPEPRSTVPVRSARPAERTARNLLRTLERLGGNRLELHVSDPMASVIWYDGLRRLDETPISPEVAGALTEELERLASGAPGSFRLNVGGGLRSFSVARLSGIGRTIAHVKRFDPEFVTNSLLPFGMSPDEETTFRDRLHRPGVLWLSAPPGEGLTSLYLSSLLTSLPFHPRVVSVEADHRLRLPEVLQLPWPEEGAEQRALLRSLTQLSPSLVGFETRSASELDGLETICERGATLIIAVSGTSLLSMLRRLHSLAPRLAPHVGLAVQLRLLPRLCPDCLVARRPTESEAKKLLTHFAERAPQVVAQARGCEACLEGQRGRLPIIELIPFSERLQRAVRAGDHHELSAERRGRSFKDKLLLALERGEVGLSALS